MTKRAKLWIGVLCGIFLLLVGAFMAVLLLGPNEKRREVYRLDGECLELVSKIQDRATADFYEPALQAKLGEAIQKLKSQEYIDALIDDSFLNVLYDYCHNHQAVWFGSEEFRQADCLTSACSALIEREAYENRTVGELLKVYLNERIIFDSYSVRTLRDRMLWKPTYEEIDRMSK